METKRETKTEILNSIFRHLVGIGRIKTQQDIVDAIGGNKANISSAFNGNERYLTVNLLCRINGAFGNIFNDDWIVAGRPPMLIDDAQGSDKGKYEKHKNDDNFRLVPLYSQDVVGGINNQEMDTNGYVTGYMPFVNAKEDDICVPVTNNSMTPIYPPGTIIQIRKIDYWREYLDLGGVHVIELMDERRLIKRVKEGSDKNHFKLVSENPDYDDSEVSLDFIRSVWIVLSKYQKVVM